MLLILTYVLLRDSKAFDALDVPLGSGQSN